MQRYADDDGNETVEVWDCSADCPVALLDAQSLSGGASRFFYCAKPSRRERDKGLEELEKKYLATMKDGIGEREHNKYQPSAYVRNIHPTVKALALMRWLTRLVCPEGGTVIDPFAGSCSGGVGALHEGFIWRGCELSAEYAEIGKGRLEDA